MLDVRPKVNVIAGGGKQIHNSLGNWTESEFNCCWGRRFIFSDGC